MRNAICASRTKMQYFDLRLPLALTMLWAALAAKADDPPKAGQRPNILFILSDDHAAAR